MVRRPRQRHLVHPGDRWTRQQSGPRLARHCDGSRAGRSSAQPGRPPVEPADADDHWRVQAHTPARIVVEIRSADLAVESEP